MILQEVESIEPFDALESQQKSETLAWILSGAQLCRTEKPSTPPCHLVSYFVVVDGDYILLVDHKNAGLWLPTGGHVEPDEHPRETVLREAKEELSIEAKFLFLQKPLFITSTTTVGQTAGHTDVSFWYVLEGDRTASLAFDREEFHDVRWFLPEEVPFEKSDPHMRRFLRKMQACLTGAGHQAGRGRVSK